MFQAQTSPRQGRNGGQTVVNAVASHATNRLLPLMLCSSSHKGENGIERLCGRLLAQQVEKCTVTLELDLDRVVADWQGFKEDATTKGLIGNTSSSMCRQGHAKYDSVSKKIKSTSRHVQDQEWRAVSGDNDGDGDGIASGCEAKIVRLPEVQAARTRMDDTVDDPMIYFPTERHSANSTVTVYI